MITAPFWGSPVVPGQVRVYLALITSLILLPVVRAPLPPGLGDSLLSLALSVSMELLIGFVFAYVAILMFAAVQFAGQLADISMGFGVANVIDPLTSAQVTLIGQIQYMAALLVFLMLDGHHILLRGLAETFVVAPPGHPFNWGVPIMILVERGGRLMFLLAAQVAAPVLTALFLANLAMGLVSRVLPQINIFLVGLPINVGLGILVLAAGMTLFPAVMRGAIGDLNRQLGALVAALR